MSGSLRDQLAAVLGPGNDDAAAFEQADAVLDVLAAEQAAERDRAGTGIRTMLWQLESHRADRAEAALARLRLVGICGHSPVEGLLCDLRDGHRGFHEGTHAGVWSDAAGAMPRSHWTDVP